MNEFLNDPEIIGEFINESREHLESLEPKLLQLEKEPHNFDLLNDIFRTFHTLKGSSSFLGLTQITELSHKSENILDELRKGEFEVTPEIIDFIFQATDILKSLIEDIASGEEDKIKEATSGSSEVSEIINRVEEVIKRPSSKEMETERIEKEEMELFLNAAQQYLSIIAECIDKLKKKTYEPEIIDALFRAFHSLRSSADYIGFSEIKNIAEEKEKSLQKIREKKASLSGKTTETLNSSYHTLVKLIESIEIVGEKVLKTKTSLKDNKDKEVSKIGKEVSSKKSLPQKKIGLEKSIRVSEDKLDLLMNLTGELVINRGALFSIAEKLEAEEKIHQSSKELREAVEVMNTITRDLQTVVMDMHMLPIKNLFNKFPRMVRDLCQKKNKKIELKISGEETHLDKMMIEKLADPLIHLIRNAIDHGIENPEERKSKGKVEKGTIKLSASQEGESVIIQIEDDGRGIDSELICQTAIKKGIIDEEKAKSLNEKERLDLIFVPGFSTAEKITDVSGRGVGMDVVMTAVKDLRGEIDIDTHVNRGTVFTIMLPLTLAILKTFLIEVNRQTFALPLNSVKETLEIYPEQIKGILNKEAIVIRGRVVGIAYLSDLLNLSNNESVSNKHISIVVIEGGGKELGIAVDTLQRQEEIVIKPLEGCLTDSKGLAGATILGDGRVVLILDPRELIQLAVDGK